MIRDEDDSTVGLAPGDLVVRWEVSPAMVLNQ